MKYSKEKVKDWIKKDGLSHLVLLALLGFVWTLPGACSAKEGESEKYTPYPPDTIKTPVLYYSVPYKEYKLDALIRVGVDSTTYVDQDSLTKKKVRGRVYTYYEPFIDSSRGPDGKPLFDSSGAAKTRILHVPILSSNVVRDMNINTDSLIKSKN